MVTRPMYKNNVSQIERKEKKYIKSSLHPSTCTLPLIMTTLITKTTFPFCHEWQRIRVSSRHLIGRASISIIIIQSIIIITIIISLILRIRSHRRRWWRDSLRSKSTHGHLSSSYTANMDIHLIQLCGKCFEASIHALKLRHDVSQRHIARRRRRSRCGSSRMRWSRTGARCRILL